jgi:polyribonucleotide nucleotidyltransferase
MSLGGKKDGLIHISELADFRVNRTEDVVKTGDIVTAKCIGIDDKGRIKMSRKAAMKDKDAAAAGGDAAPAPAEDNG